MKIKISKYSIILHLVTSELSFLQQRFGMIQKENISKLLMVLIFGKIGSYRFLHVKLASRLIIIIMFNKILTEWSSYVESIIGLERTKVM